MKRISNKVFSHLSLKTKDRTFIGEIRASKGLEVSSFRELVKKLAYISFNNPELNLYYRGQRHDYKNNKSASYLYPSLYRGVREKVRSGNNLDARVAILRESQKRLIECFKKHKLAGHDSLYRYEEIQWAILQHYEVCGTPLLDITSSLRAACSFALQSAEHHGYLYVLGLPQVNGSISYYVEEEMLNVKLSSICPPQALRPYFQEGLLVGCFPSELKSPSWARIDVASRMIAKFKLVKDSFWDDEFQEIPSKSFFPDEDPVLHICEDIIESIQLTSSYSRRSKLRG